MKRFHRIIVGVDLGNGPGFPAPDAPDEATRRAVSKAAWLTRNVAAELRLVSVAYLAVHVEPTWRHVAEPGDRPLVAKALARLDDIAAELRGQGIETSVELRFGQAVDQLLEAARSWSADLVVVGGARKENALGLLGSTSTRLFLQSPSTVWIARKGDVPPAPELLAAVSLDDRVHGVLELAASFARLTDARLNVVSVVEAPDPERLESAREALAAWTAPYAEEVRLGAVDAVAGNAGAAVLERVAAHGADVVFVGPSRRSAITTYLGGRPTAAVLKQVDCSLVCARRPDTAAAPEEPGV